MNISDIREKVELVFNIQHPFITNNPVEYEIAKLLIDYVEKHESSIDYITASRMYEAFDSRFDVSDISIVLAKMSGTFGFLEINYEFYDGNATIPLEMSDVFDAEDTNVFLHPISKEPVDKWREKVGYFLTVNKDVTFN